MREGSPLTPRSRNCFRAAKSTCDLYQAKLKSSQYRHCLQELADRKFDAFCFDARPPTPAQRRRQVLMNRRVAAANRETRIKMWARWTLIESSLAALPSSRTATNSTDLDAERATQQCVDRILSNFPTFSRKIPLFFSAQGPDPAVLLRRRRRGVRVLLRPDDGGAAGGLPGGGRGRLRRVLLQQQPQRAPRGQEGRRGVRGTQSEAAMSVA